VLQCVLQRVARCCRCLIIMRTVKVFCSVCCSVCSSVSRYNAVRCSAMCRDIGLFCRDIGLFCGDKGLFCGDIGLFE